LKEKETPKILFIILVEDYDQKILSNPQKHIINKGGSIFFAKKIKKLLGLLR